MSDNAVKICYASSEKSEFNSQIPYLQKFFQVGMGLADPTKGMVSW